MSGSYEVHKVMNLDDHPGILDLCACAFHPSWNLEILLAQLREISFILFYSYHCLVTYKVSGYDKLSHPGVL